MPITSKKIYLKSNVKCKLLNVSNSKGFTLIELLIVITIIALLAGLGTAAYSIGQQKARDNKRKSDLKALSSALNLYNQDKDSYPNTANSTNLSPYISPIPQDPTTNSVYTYTPSGCVGNVCISYTLTACLENSKDTQRDTTNTCASPLVSYTVTNPG